MAKKDKLSVSVVITNFNGEDLLKKNLPSVLKASENKKNRIREIIVSDDGSWDNSVKVLKKDFPEVKAVLLKQNQGFSAAANAGVKKAKEDLVVLLNNDLVPEEDFLEDTFKHFKDEKVFGVSLHERGYGWAKGRFEDGYIVHQPGKETKKAHQTFWVNGGSGVWRKDIWKKLGGLDHDVLSPFYWEDIDLCYRALKRGYRLVWEPDSIVHHEHETTIGKFDRKTVERIRERNQLLFNWKNLTSPRLIRKHIRGAIARCFRHPGYLRIVLMAIGRLGRVFKARRKEIKETVVSDEAIFARFE